MLGFLDMVHCFDDMVHDVEMVKYYFVVSVRNMCLIGIDEGRLYVEVDRFDVGASFRSEGCKVRGEVFFFVFFVDVFYCCFIKVVY